MKELIENEIKDFELIETPMKEGKFFTACAKNKISGRYLFLKWKIKKSWMKQYQACKEYDSQYFADMDGVYYPGDYSACNWSIFEVHAKAS